MRTEMAGSSKAIANGFVHPGRSSGNEDLSSSFGACALPVEPVPFVKKLRQDALQKRIPLSAVVELTASCNLDCRFCYLKNCEAFQGRLSTSQWQEILASLAQQGCLFLGISGGEPLVRPDFLELYSFVVHLGMLPTVSTNGTLIDREIADGLARLPPYSVEMTLHGTTPEVFDRVTRVAGSFEKFMNALDLLLARDITVALKSTVTRANYHQVEEMAAFASERGLSFRFDPLLMPALNGDAHFLEERLSPREVAELEAKTSRRAEAWRDAFSTLSRPGQDSRSNSQGALLFQCLAFRSHCHVDPQGRLSGCVTAREPAGSLSGHSFEALWNGPLKGKANERRLPGTQCLKCPYLSICPVCPGWSLLETGSPQRAIPYVCELMEERAHRFGSTRLPGPKGDDVS